VLRVAAIYLGSAWLVIEVANTTVPRLGLPDAWISGVIVLALVCFPAVVAGAWFFDLAARRGLTDGAAAALGDGRPVSVYSPQRCWVRPCWPWSAGPRCSAPRMNRPPTGAPPQHVAVLYFEDRTAGSCLRLAGRYPDGNPDFRARPGPGAARRIEQRRARPVRCRAAPGQSRPSPRRGHAGQRQPEQRRRQCSPARPARRCRQRRSPEHGRIHAQRDGRLRARRRIRAPTSRPFSVPGSDDRSRCTRPRVRCTPAPGRCCNAPGS
jgi:hypothetical protein